MAQIAALIALTLVLAVPCEAQEKVFRREALEVRWHAARHEAATRARQDFFAANPQAQPELDLEPSRKIAEKS